MNLQNDLLHSLIETERQARTPLNAKWEELWRLYKTNPLRINKNDEWHSKLNDGRIFEIIETVGAYFRNALFHSDYWVELESHEPGLAEIVPLASAYFRNCLNSSNLFRELRVATTQLLLTGFCAMRVFWDNEEDKIAFECLNASHTYIESGRRYNPKFSYSFREFLLNKAEFLEWANSGFFNQLSEDAESAFEKLSTTSPSSRELADDLPSPLANEFVEIVEFYDPIDGRLYRICENIVLHEEEGLSECPWLIGILFETPESAYGISLVDSSLGLILENNILMNRRLDNIAVSVDNMWLFIDDGITDPNQIKTEPGKVISVGRPDALTPLRPPANNFNITYNEAAVLDAKIDRNIGTGAMISANTFRTGERVTAQEIQSVKEAGGNRLTDVFSLYEKTFIIPLLQRAYKIVRAHTTKQKTIKLKGSKPGVSNYFKLLPSDLKKSFTVRVTATQSLINRDHKIKLLTDFITLTGSVPQFASLLDWKALFYDLLVSFGFDDPEKYVVKPDESAEATQATQAEASLASPSSPSLSPLEALNQQLMAIGGPSYSQALQEKTAAGEVPEAFMALGGMPPSEQPIPDEEAALLQQALSTPL
jgi:hypothetical protein